MADKGDHAAGTLDCCGDVGCTGVKTDLPEPHRKTEWDWESRPKSEQRAVTNNRHRTQRDYGRRLQRRRSEVVERSFAHVCETGGGRRSWLPGIDEVRKRHLLAAMAHNLGLVLRKLLGSGKAREFAALWAHAWAFVCALLWPLAALRRLIASLERFAARFRETPRPTNLAA